MIIHLPPLSVSEAQRRTIIQKHQRIVELLSEYDKRDILTPGEIWELKDKDVLFTQTWGHHLHSPLLQQEDENVPPLPHGENLHLHSRPDLNPEQEE